MWHEPTEPYRDCVIVILWTVILWNLVSRVSFDVRWETEEGARAYCGVGVGLCVSGSVCV